MSAPPPKRSSLALPRPLPLAEDKREGVGRRGFTGLLAALAALAATGCATEDDVEQVEAKGYLLPPPGAKVQTTACAYCSVGCGYKAYTWRVGEPSGGPAAAQNAFGVDFPTRVMSGYWVAPQMYNVVDIDGVPHHIVVIADAETKVVNVGGDFNLGGSLAQRFYVPGGNTKDRLLRPALRIGEQLIPIRWEDAIAILAGVSRHVRSAHGALAWGMKTYSYQFYENTYAITKLCFDAVKTPCWAPHDQPADGSSTPGLSDAGIDGFSAAYADWAEADVIFVSGVGLAEQRAIVFSQWVTKNASLVVVNPRRDETADHAVENGGMFLQVRPGTDTLLHHAIARVILESGWEDKAFIADQTASAEALALETSARRKRFGVTFDSYRAFILANDRHKPEVAAEIIGISAADIREAARRMAEPKPDGTRPKTSVMLEKGNYWSHNYANTASLASLALLVGAGNRPGRMLSRGGGHQRGMIAAAKYPIDLSPNELGGQKVPLNLDRWLLEGKLRFAWVIGCTWVGGGSAHAHALYGMVQAQARGAGLPQLTEALAFPSGRDGPVDVAAVVARLNARADAGGMVFVQQDIYPQATTALADLVLPAASWGEAPFTRMQGERRLRLYPRLADAPGEARPDWQIIADFAKSMGYAGFDWPDANAVFEEAAEKSKNTPHDYAELVAFARDKRISGHDHLGSLGTTGLQCPIVRDGDQLVGTVRLHEAGFATTSKKAVFLRADYAELVEARSGVLAPRPGELQIINRRSCSTWSSLVEDARNPFRVRQLPDNFLELHPDDATALGIAGGDEVIVSTDGLSPVTGSADRAASFRARAVLTNAVRPGVACTYFNFRGDPATAANAVVSNDPDPVSNLFSFKLGRGRVTRA